MLSILCFLVPISATPLLAAGEYEILLSLGDLSDLRRDFGIVVYAGTHAHFGPCIPSKFIQHFLLVS